MNSMIVQSWRVIGPAMELGEGGRLIDDRFVQVDLLAGRLYAIDLSTQQLRLVQYLDVPLGAVAPVADRPGWWIAAAGTGVAALGPDDDVNWIGRVADDTPVAMRINDGVCDPAGRFWVGSMAYNPSAATGALYRVDADLSITQVLDGIAVPNGPAFNADGTVMFVADSAAGVITRITLDSAGDPTGRDEFARVNGSPDGMTVDAADHLRSAVWGAGVVHRYAPSGALVEVVRTPAIQPTSVAIGAGRALVTSAAHGLRHPSEPDGCTFVADCAVDGLPTAAFRTDSLTSFEGAHA